MLRWISQRSGRAKPAESRTDLANDVGRDHEPDVGREVSKDAVADELQALALRTKQGDRDATRVLLLRIAPAVRAVVVRVLPFGHADVDDMVQESMLAFVRALDGFRGESSVLHFARRITLFRVIEERKRARALKRDGGTQSSWDIADVMDARPHNDAAMSARRRVLLRELLLDLRPEQAEVLALRHVLDYSVEEIAQQTGVPTNTVRSRLRLAKESLRERIDRTAALADLDVRVS